MKKTLLALTALAAMALAFTGCTPSSGNPNPNPNPATSTGTVIYETEVDLGWSYTQIEAAKIADATDDSVLEFTMSKSADDYQVIQICLADDSKIVGGTLTNASLNDNSDGFVPSFATETFSYKPTAAEWASLKTDGIRFQGHGIKVTKIVLK